MPYIQEWVEPKKSLKLKVHIELPSGYLEVDKNSSISRQYRMASIGGEPFAIPDKSLHFCDKCNGWINGWPNDYEINTLDGRRLAGRRGTEYHCARCGHKIGFFGMMS